MRTLRPALATLAAAALALAIGAAPANASDPKPDGDAKTTAHRAVAADAGRGAPVTSQAVTAASSTIQARIVDYVRSRGTRYTFGAYADATTGKVVVETDAPKDVVSSLVGAYGDVVDVRGHGVADNFSRRDDVPSFWGGAGITLSVPTPHCSSGYTVQNSAGTRFQVTAGHCFTDGQTAVTELGGRVVGTVSGNGLPSQDMELIGGQSYSPYIYLGGVDSGTGAHIASAADPVVGFADYCHSGRTTGENCGHTATSTTATVCTSSGCKSPVTAFTGGVLPQGGDSGSPFYVGSVSAPDKHIRGHVIAVGGSTAYAELWSRVATRFGVTIVT